MLKGKKALITGVISERSIAYAIAQAMHREGAELAFTYAGEQFKERVRKIVTPCMPKALLPCDVSSDQQIDNLFSELTTTWQGFDILVHAIAYAPQDQLEGDFINNINREGFRVAHDISSYSFYALAKGARPMMQGRHGALLTLTYLGAEKAIVNYNTMALAKASLEAGTRYAAMTLGPENIRVNAISAGPIRTLAASGIAGFKKMLDYVACTSPLKRNVSAQEVANVAAFLCSDLASAITGEIIHVDCGFNSVGIPWV